MEFLGFRICPKCGEQNTIGRKGIGVRLLLSFLVEGPVYYPAAC